MRNQINWKTAILVGIIFIIIGIYLQIPIKTVKINLSSFPDIVGEWQRSEGQIPCEDLSSLGAEETLARQYRSAGGKLIELCVAYFDVQAQSKKLIGYRTERFLLGNNPVEIGLTSIDEIEVRKIVQRVGASYRLLLCWYEMDGESRADTWWIAIRTVRNGLFHRRTNGGIVTVAIKYESSEHLEELSGQLSGFIQRALPDIKRLLKAT